MERDDAHPSSAGPGSHEPGSHEPGPQTATQPATSTGRKAGAPDPRRLVPGGVHHCRCLLVLQSSYGDGPKLIVARWAPQPVSTPTLPPENLPSSAQPAPSTVQVAAAEVAPAQATPPPATLLAQAAPQDAAPAAPAAPPDQTQLLQTIARDLANLERTIEQLKANQQQVANDNSKAIAELKATQEEMKRALAKVSEPNPPAASLRHRLRHSQPRPCASPSGRLSGHRRERGLRYPKGMDLRRRLVAADSVIIALIGALRHRGLT